ncbi:hypothetical protein AVEN_45620-1 [Araneus ventricosus]|uniref:Uncharacterized protein n=1 Tax=Araneus ventricosus TaxID=182803 RepID=A0A4Y2ER28_ARAVE|nr:hypothetical protein AVEN_45620-1 [Araneus ventricosus]
MKQYLDRCVKSASGFYLSHRIQDELISSLDKKARKGPQRISEPGGQNNLNPPLTVKLPFLSERFFQGLPYGADTISSTDAIPFFGLRETVTSRFEPLSSSAQLCVVGDLPSVSPHDGRYVSAPEAMWRLNECSLSEKSHVGNHEVGHSLAKPTASDKKKVQ